MFLNEDRIVFSLLMILFTFSRFIFCPCDSVSSWLLVSVSFGSVVFSFGSIILLLYHSDVIIVLDNTG